MTTFSNSAVQQKLSTFKLLRIDVTKNSMDNQLLGQHFGVIAPPVILFFQNGKEITALRMIGYQSPQDFLKRLDPN